MQKIVYGKCTALPLRHIVLCLRCWINSKCH